jgi:preprotein translocase subunit SecA
MYQVLAGMTGTAATEAEEFHKIYDLEVVVVPTNEPMIRKNHPDVVYKTARAAKYAAVVREIEECHRKGQPVLVGTTSIEKNEIIDKFLKKKGIPHNILNAKQHEKEALVIAEAGSKGAVTVATNMAGRGVDIVLGGKRLEPWEVEDKKEWKKLEKEWKEKHEEIIKLGGLHVIGTERHESRRIDNQLRGRSGRQGDPGSSRFFVSLEDDIMRIFGGEQVSKLMTMFKLPEDQPLEHKMVSRAIEQAQVKVEGFNFDARKHLVEYDDVLNKQREIVYGIREKVLGGEKMKEEILGKIEEEVKNMVLMYSPEGYTEPENENIIRNFCEIVPFDDASQKQLITQISKLKTPNKISDFLLKIVTDLYEGREKQVDEKTAREMEKFAYLSSIDHLWMGHLDALGHLREGVGLRGYGQRDPLVEYKNEAFQMFDRLVKQIDYEIIRRIFRIQVARRPAEAVARRPAEALAKGGPTPPQDIQENIDTSDMTGLAQAPAATPTPQPVGPASPTGGPVKTKKLGRNDPCPCGSGKKYKKCHYPEYG